MSSYSSTCQKFKNQSDGPKIKVTAGLPSFRGSRGESIPCLFQLPETTCTPWPLACSLHHCNLCPSVTSLSLWLSCLGLTRTLYWALPGSSDHLPILRSLICKWCKVTYSQAPGIRTWLSLGGHDSAYWSAGFLMFNLKYVEFLESVDLQVSLNLGKHFFKKFFFHFAAHFSFCDANTYVWGRLICFLCALLIFLVFFSLCFSLCW